MFASFEEYIAQSLRDGLADSEPEAVQKALRFLAEENDRENKEIYERTMKAAYDFMDRYPNALEALAK